MGVEGRFTRRFGGARLVEELTLKLLLGQLKGETSVVRWDNEFIGGQQGAHWVTSCEVLGEVVEGERRGYFFHADVRLFSSKG